MSEINCCWCQEPLNKNAYRNRFCGAECALHTAMAEAEEEFGVFLWLAPGFAGWLSEHNLKHLEFLKDANDGRAGFDKTQQTHELLKRRDDHVAHQK